MIVRLRKNAKTGRAAAAATLCLALAYALSSSPALSEWSLSPSEWFGLGAKRETVSARAERDVVILPNGAPTLWVGRKIARAVRDRAPDWVEEMLAPKGPLSVAAALATPFRTIELSPSKRWSPHGVVGSDGLIDIEINTGTTKSTADKKLDPAVAAAIEAEPNTRAPAPAAKPTTKTKTSAVPARSRAKTKGGRITILLTALGVNARASRRALAALPREIAVAVPPIVRNPRKWVIAARKSGRVVLAELPMEPESRAADPGPLTLRVDAGPEANLALLAKTLKKLRGVHGVATYRGGRFTANADALRPVLKALHAKSLFLVETAPGPLSRVGELGREIGLKTVASVVSLDKAGRARDITDGLALLEAEARRTGRALGVAVAIPSTIRALDAWADKARARGITLTPLQL